MQNFFKKKTLQFTNTSHIIGILEEDEDRPFCI